MCGRYTLTFSAKELSKAFKCKESDLILKSHYNIAPSQTVPVVLRNSQTDRNELSPFKWGFVPTWSKTPTPEYQIINARSETINIKPAFRKAFASQRCLIPADSFFEWAHNTRPKQPVRILKKDKGLIAFAGIWDKCYAEGEIFWSFAILTTKANSLLESIHHRMPVIIDSKDYSTWLDPNPLSLLTLLALLCPYPSEKLMLYPVNRMVNNPHYDTPECIAPLSTSLAI